MFKELLTSTKTHAQLFRYFFVAAVGLIVDFSFVVFCKEVLDIYYLVAVAIGFICGLFVTYILSNRFVFGMPKGSQLKSFVLFGVIGLVGLLILSVLVWLMADKMGVNYLIAKCLATIIVFLWNFIARRTLYDPQKINLPYEL